jgi:hypothetical protein
VFLKPAPAIERRAKLRGRECRHGALAVGRKSVPPRIANPHLAKLDELPARFHPAPVSASRAWLTSSATRDTEKLCAIRSACVAPLWPALASKTRARRWS